jgi:hypothetical protein
MAVRFLAVFELLLPAKRHHGYVERQEEFHSHFRQNIPNDTALVVLRDI